MKVFRRLEAVAMFLGGISMIVAPIALHAWWPFIVFGLVSGASTAVISAFAWIIAGDLEQVVNDRRDLRADAKNATKQ